MAGTYVADLRRWRREDATRFDAIREQAYTAFLAEVAKAQFTGWPFSAIPPSTASALWLSKSRVDLHSDPGIQERVRNLVEILDRPPDSDSEKHFARAYSAVMGSFRDRLGVKEPK
jgi:hypothetical protein